MVRVLLGKGQEFPLSELEGLIGTDVDSSYLQKRIDEINEQQCASAKGRRLIIQKAVESDTEADYRLYVRPCARSYGFIHLPDSEERSIGEYIVSYQHGRPYQIRQRISRYLVETLYFVAWDTQQEGELRQAAGEIHNEELVAVSDEAMDLVRLIPVHRGDLPDGRHLLEKLGIITDLHKVAENVVTSLITSNNLLSSLTSDEVKIFKESMKIALELFTPCLTRDDFLRKIGALDNLFEVKLQPIRNLITNPDSSWKSRKLIKEWFIQEGVTFNQQIFEVWEKINTLRNSTFPYHSGDSRAVGAIRFFGLDFPPDYGRLWENILLTFYSSLQKFQVALGTISPRGCQRSSS